jgi:hypothetical protein
MATTRLEEEEDRDESPVSPPRSARSLGTEAERWHRLEEEDDRVGWPLTHQSLTTNLHGWFRTGNETTLRRLLPQNGECVLELGSWLGRSTKYICERCPQSAVIAVDIWLNEYFDDDSHYNKNDAEFSSILRSNSIYDQFLSNLRDHRVQDRSDGTVVGLIPMKMTSTEALKLIHELGIEPSLIYIDASHHYDYVVSDVSTCLRLFPKAVLVGDDWDNNDVRRAVEDIAKAEKLQIFVQGKTCWTFAKEQLLKVIESEKRVEEEKQKQQQLIVNMRSKRKFDANAVREMLKRSKK